MREQFTEYANRALNQAKKRANEYGTGYVGSEHLLLGLLMEPDGAAGMVLREMGVDLKKLLELVDKLIVPEGELKDAGGYTPRASQILENSVREASALQMKQAGTEHILMAMIKDAGVCGHETSSHHGGEYSEALYGHIGQHGCRGGDVQGAGTECPEYEGRQFHPDA